MILASLVLLLAVATAPAPPATAEGRKPASAAVTSPRGGVWIGGAPAPRPMGIPGRWVFVPSRRGVPAEDPAAAAAADSSPAYVGPPPVGAGDEPIEIEPIELVESEAWLRAPFGDQLIVDPARWRSERAHDRHGDIHAEYNRVDQLRLGASMQFQNPETMMPRLGARYEYALGRKRSLYGVQVEQPLGRPDRIAIGVSMVRRTDHSELQQVDDLENTLALLFGRQDYRDYFEREGAGVYLSWRVPDFSTVSLHARTDDFRSLAVNRGTRSWFQRDRILRENPPIEEGTERSVQLRLERMTRKSARTRAGLYHWIELERAGGGLGGDFDFTRALADVRSVLRLTPATTLSVRGVAGYTAAGRLPRQRWFPLGGVDGLRAHTFSQYLGDQLLLAQAEYDVGLWRQYYGSFSGGLHAIVFVDAGMAWFNPGHRWDVNDQRIESDAGFGLATSDDALRVYFAKNLRNLDSDFVISMRLQRPF